MSDAQPKCTFCGFEGRVFAIVIRAGDLWWPICPHCAGKASREAVKAAKGTEGGVAGKTLDILLPGM